MDLLFSGGVFKIIRFEKSIRNYSRFDPSWVSNPLIILSKVQEKNHEFSFDIQGLRSEFVGSDIE